MEFHEYPKALYRYGVMAQANSFDEEERLRADGYQGHAEDASGSVYVPQAEEDAEAPVAAPTMAEPDPSLPPVRNKPGRKPKAQ